jgi:Flp pilus assembly protein CpaB
VLNRFYPGDAVDDIAEGRRKKEEGKRKKEEAIKSMVFAMNKVLTVEVAITQIFSNFY